VEATQIGTVRSLPQPGKLIWVKVCAATLWLSHEAEVTTTPSWRAVHSDDRERAARTLQAAYALREWRGNTRTTIGPWGLRWPGTLAFQPGTGVFRRANAAIRVVGVILNFYRRKRLEQQLLQSQSLRASGGWQASIAHDFNNLLTIIMGMLIWSWRRWVRRTLCRVHAGTFQAAMQAAGLTRQLVSFSRRSGCRTQNHRGE